MTSRARRRRSLTPRRRDDDPQPGMAARWPGDCPRCPEPIVKGDRIIYVHGHPIHIHCAGGADDE